MTALAHPGLLWTGVALASVPILIHLFFRRRHRVVRWAAMTWLLAALRKQKRRIQVENLILLLMRCAVIALLALAIARPSVQAAALNPFSGSTRGLVLIIDTSASMGAQHTGRRSLERAKEHAGELLGELGNSSKITLLATRDDLTGGAPRALLEGGSPGDVRRVLGSLRLANGPNRLGEVFRLAAQKLERLAGKRLVVFVTDLQASDWRSTDGARHEDVYRALRNLRGDTDTEPPPVTVLDVGTADAANVAITAFQVERGRDAIAGLRAGLTISLVNFGPNPVDGTVTLSKHVPGNPKPTPLVGRNVTIPPTIGALGGKVENVQLQQFLPKGSEGPARFEVSFTAKGGADRLAVDSHRLLSLVVKPPVRFLPVRSHRDAMNVLRDVDVLEVVEFLDAIPPEALAKQDLSDADAIVWADADVFALDDDERAGVQNLKRFVRRGGGLLFYLGDNSKPDVINKLFYEERGQGLIPMRLDPAPQPVDVSEHPVLFDHESGAQSPLFEEAAFAGSPEVLHYRAVTDCPPEKIVARYDDGAPAVIEHTYGRGRVLIVTTTPDERWFRLNGSLLPAAFLFNAAHYLVADDPAARNVTVGQPVRLLMPPGAREVVVEPPEAAGGRTEEPVADANEPFVLTETTVPGFYRITIKGVTTVGASSLPTQEVHYAAVNLDTVESDLRRIDPRELESRYQGARLHVTADAVEVLPQAAASEEKGELSRGLLLGVVVLLLAELVVAWRFGMRRRPS